MEFVLKADPEQMDDNNKTEINNVIESIAGSLPEDGTPIEMENLAITALKPDKPVDLVKPRNTNSLQASSVSLPSCYYKVCNVCRIEGPE